MKRLGILVITLFMILNTMACTDETPQENPPTSPEELPEEVIQPGLQVEHFVEENTLYLSYEDAWIEIMELNPDEALTAVYLDDENQIYLETTPDVFSETGITFEVITVIFEANGAFVDEISGLKGFNVEAPQPPQIDGYDFVEWSAPLTMIENSQVIEAMYEAIPLAREFTGAYIPNENIQSFVVEANPEQGFNIPYFIYLPSTTYQNENEYDPAHLLLEGLNYGITTNDIESSLLENLARGETPHVVGEITEALFIPKIVPYLPKTCFLMETETGSEKGHFHALDSTVIHMDAHIDALEECRFTPDDELLLGRDYLEKLMDIDAQIFAMVEDAQTRLNASGWHLEETIFVAGFSASGGFADAFTSMYPSKVQAMFAGGLFIPTIPAPSYQGLDLPYQIGVNDHGIIAGDAFDLEAFNQVAKIYYMGELETIDAVAAPDVYTDEHREIIYDLYGTQSINSRWYNAQDVFFEVGGEGIFLTDKNEAHYTSSTVVDYVIQTFKLNRGTSTALYDMNPPGDDIVLHSNLGLIGDPDLEGAAQSSTCELDVSFENQTVGTLGILSTIDPYQGNHPFNQLELQNVGTSIEFTDPMKRAEYLIIIDIMGRDYNDLCDYWGTTSLTEEALSYYRKGDQKVVRLYAETENEMIDLIASLSPDLLDIDWQTAPIID